MDRAYSVLHVKAVDVERRVITGTATTPEPDRVGDVIEPHGAKFARSLPLLLFHDSTRPVGTVKLHKPTDDGITFEAQIPEISAPPSLKERVDEAWTSVKAGLVKGVSIGFRALDDGVELMRSGGYRFKQIEILELSLVAIPANAAATIATFKSIDAPHLAASGLGSGASPPSGVTDARRVVKTARSDRPMQKPIGDQIRDFEATRETKQAEMTAIMTASSETGETLDKEQAEKYDTLKEEIKAINEHLVRLADLEEVNKSMAKPVNGNSPDEGSLSRYATGNGHDQHPVISVKQHLPPGIEFTRLVLCRAVQYMTGVPAMEVAKARYPDNPRIQTYLKATVTAGTTTDTAWAGVLVDPTNLSSEFAEYLRPQTILGQFGMNGVPPLRRVPFNIRYIGQTTGGNGYWVGEGAPKPLTKFDFNATTLQWNKVAAIAVISQELARFSSPSAETLVRDSLAAALIEKINEDFIDPTVSAVAGVNPASITNGLTPLASSGTDADAVRADLQTLIGTFLTSNQRVGSLVLIMPETLALALSLMVNGLGQPEFPNITMAGGTLRGIPVVTSQYAAAFSAGGGNLVIAVNASEILLADDGGVDIDVSRETALQMLDNPTNNSATGTATTMVSMYQTNSIAVKAERFITWARHRTGAVAYMDDVGWGGAGSPTV